MRSWNNRSTWLGKLLLWERDQYIWLTSCLVKLLSLLAFIRGSSNSLTSSRQSLVGVATFITCSRYLQEEHRR